MVDRYTKVVLTVIVAACVVVAIAAVAYAAGKTSAPEVLRAQAFEVVDAEGKVCAVLGLRGDGGGNLDLMDAKGLKRATLSVLPNGGPVLMLSDARGEERATLTVHSLTVRDETGGERAALQVPRGSHPGLVLRD